MRPLRKAQAVFRAFQQVNETMPIQLALSFLFGLVGHYRVFLSGTAETPARSL